VFISFNKTIWWVFDRATIAGGCVPIMCRGTTKICDEESLMCSASEAAAVKEGHHRRQLVDGWPAGLHHRW